MEKIQIYFFAGLFLAVLLLSFFILLPFLVPLSIAATLAVLFHRFHERLTHFIGGYRGLAALLTVIIAALIIILPILLIGTVVLREALSFPAWLSGGGAEGINSAFVSAEKQISNYLPGSSINFNLSEYINLGANWLAQNMGAVFAGVAERTVGFFFSLVILLIAFFYFLKDGKNFIKAIAELSPLPDKNDYEILNKIETTIVSVVRGSLFVSLIQGIASFTGFSIFGIYNPALLGGIAAVTSLIPGIGVALVMVPSLIYLFAIGATSHGIGLLIWWIVMIVLIDNMASPMLIRRGTKIHPLMILLSVIGGLAYFGPIGLLLGPVVLSLLFAMIEIYKLLMESEKKSFG
ncbi:MAG TPA: AI-2E family transporter [Candidatus Paceibacterota bacterium]|nr:AI-2E family transporter [Candidatus Paceibacterota bacterium]